MAAIDRTFFSSRSSLRFLRHLCSSNRRCDLQILREVVLEGAGGLDEMESALNDLHMSVSPSLAAEVFQSATGGVATSRRLLRFFSWSRRRSCAPEESLWWGDPFREAIRCFADNKDAAAITILISELSRRRRQMPPDVFTSVAESLVKLCRPDDVIRLLNLQLEEGRQSGKIILAAVHALCGGGHAAAAAKLVARRSGELTPAEMTAARRNLLHGWCRGRNAREARKMLEEMKASGEAPGGGAYLELFRCLCERNLKFNAAALLPEAFSVVAEMRAAGELPTPATVNVLLSCLVRARRVKEAWNVLQSMRRGENGRPAPDWVSYYHVTRVMFLSGRYVRGKRVFRQMVEDGVAAPPGFSGVWLGCSLEWRRSTLLWRCSMKCAKGVLTRLRWGRFMIC